MTARGHRDTDRMQIADNSVIIQQIQYDPEECENVLLQPVSKQCKTNYKLSGACTCTTCT
jgi:hypothetical protein